ncbi:MAG: energy transducer TonB [Pseudomonadota bacterium]|nr:energy transducer TonB [Pseudomonadota bacterium]
MPRISLVVSHDSFKPLPGPFEVALRRIPPKERFRWSLAGSLLIHVVLILSIGFALPKITDPGFIAPLSITLVSASSDETPEDAEFRAQADYLGGGNSKSPARATTPLALPTNQRFSMLSYETEIPDPKRIEAAGVERQQVLLAEQSDERLPAEVEARQHRDVRAEARLAQSLRDQLLADLGNARRTVQKGLREKYLGSRTQAYKYASYMEQWRAQVEEIGNLNYPDEARRRGLSGTLVLDVGIRPDGTINSVRVARSSGDKVLDDAAERIVNLASPFAPFPAEFRGEVDVLHMVRTWEFLHNRLSSQ